MPRPVELLTPALKDVLAVAFNTELASPAEQQTASTVGVPSVAVTGPVVFYTGNWYAAVSDDGGRTFRYLGPATSFAALDPPDSHFCCNQIVHYVSQIDTFVWLLQYGPDTGDNILRLAFAKTHDVVSGKWRIFDITPEALGLPASYLTTPDLAVGANFLYLTMNAFAGNVAKTAAVRFPLDGVAIGNITMQLFISMNCRCPAGRKNSTKIKDWK